MSRAHWWWPIGLNIPIWSSETIGLEHAFDGIRIIIIITIIIITLPRIYLIAHNRFDGHCLSG